VSFLALFVALGGASWAAFRLPVHSVGNAQLQNFSVGNAKLRPNSVGAGKIISGAVGTREVDSSQVQLRISGPCSVGAIQSIAASGDVTCTPALPGEFGTSVSNVTVGTQSTLIADKQLPGGPAGSSYLVLGNVQWMVSGHPQVSQSVDLRCTIVGTSSPGAEATADLDANRTMQAGTMPMAAPAMITGSHGDAIMTCSFTATPGNPAPVVTVNATVNAVQTASNG
jgi:hypothetical protein